MVGDAFPRAWITAGSNPKLWGRCGTYKKIPYEALPKLGGLDGSFAWLRGTDEPYGMAFEHQPEDEPVALDDRVAEAERAGFIVPDAFLTFMKDPNLFERIPSCTACYWDLGARLEMLPNGSALLRFMNDQQACYFWFLLLHKDGTHDVAHAWPEWKDDPTGDKLEDAVTLQEVTICADSFEEFIKRFWIENALWNRASGNKPIEGELHAYVEAARSAIDRGLVEVEAD